MHDANKCGFFLFFLNLMVFLEMTHGLKVNCAKTLWLFFRHLFHILFLKPKVNSHVVSLILSYKTFTLAICNLHVALGGNIWFMLLYVFCMHSNFQLRLTKSWCVICAFLSQLLLQGCAFHRMQVFMHNRRIAIQGPIPTPIYVMVEFFTWRGIDCLTPL